MSPGLYFHGDSPVHRLPPGIKVASLVVVGTAVFILSDWRMLVGCFAGVLALGVMARIPWRLALAQLKPVLWLLLLIFVVQVLVDGWMAGLVTVLRFAILIQLAGLVTLTTRASAMIEALEVGLRPLALVGVAPGKVSLALSLTLRFIPVISAVTQEVREAQKARGLDRSVVALVVPIIVRTLKMADDVADAIEARSYDPGHALPAVPRDGAGGSRLPGGPGAEDSLRNPRPEETSAMSTLDLPDRSNATKAGAVALGTLALAIGSWIEVPMVPVPMTLQTYVVLVIGALYGWKLGIATVILYLTEAAVGLPVLAGGKSGIAPLVGPTAGYLAGFVVAAALVGRLVERGWTASSLVRSFAAMAAGHAVILALGVAWLASKIGWGLAVSAGLIPFLIGAVVKSGLAAATVELIRRAMQAGAAAETKGTP